MRAGLLENVIFIYEPIESKDEYGATSTEWRLFKRTRARVQYASGNRELQNNELLHDYTYTFTIRGYHPVNEKMVIHWKWGRYRILSIDATTKQEIRIETALINE